MSVLVLVVLVASLVLSACGGGSAATPTNKFAAFGYKQALEFKQIYADTYPLETQTSAAFNEWWAFNDNFLGQLKDMKFLSDNCYSNVTQVLENGTIGIYDTSHSADGAPTSGVLDQNKMVSALVVNNLYPANADQCSAMLQETMKQVEVGRQTSYEKQVAFIEMRRTLDNQYNGTWGKAASKRFFDLYGQDFMDYVNGLLVKNNVEAFPTDFIGFPTTGLSVQTKDKTWYQYYADIYNGVKAPSDNRFDKDMYYSIWAGPDKGGQATLYREAAWEFMSRSFLSAATENAVDCGSGAPSLSEQMNAECTPISSDSSAVSVPTAKP
jgi:hypothetical protein